MQDYVGYRMHKRKSEQKKRRKVLIVISAVLLVVLVFYLLGGLVKVSPIDTAFDKTIDGFQWLGRKIKSVWPWSSEEREMEAFIPEGKNAANYMIGVTKKKGDVTILNSLVVASYDSEGESGSLIFFPQDMLLEIPGVGMEMLSDLIELDNGNVTLVLLGVQDLLGIELDRYIMCTDRDLSIFFNDLEPFKVVVPQDISFEDSSTGEQVDISKGEQKLSASELVAYLTYSEPGEDLERIDRQEEFVREFMERSRKDYEDILPYMKEKAALFESDAGYEEMAGLWQAFALLKEEKLDLVTVPVKVFKMENTVVHTVDKEKMGEFIDEYVKSDFSMEKERVRVEILNGCGVPGIGGDLAGRLEPDRFDVVRTANADRFDYQETLIIVYENDQEAIGVAEEIRSEIEVGRVEARARNQDVADITIVAGQDYGSR